MGAEKSKLVRNDDKEQQQQQQQKQQQNKSQSQKESSSKKRPKPQILIRTSSSTNNLRVMTADRGLARKSIAVDTMEQSDRRRSSGLLPFGASRSEGSSQKTSRSTSCSSTGSSYIVPDSADQKQLTKPPTNRTPSSQKNNNPISPRLKRIVRACFKHRTDNIGQKIYKRMREKHGDFVQFLAKVDADEAELMAVMLTEYLNKVVDSIGSMGEIEKLSIDFGSSHAKYKEAGFKADFFRSLADAATTECVLLDSAVHSQSLTFMAWSELISKMFSSVRDGYYLKLRHLRRLSSNVCVIQQQQKQKMEDEAENSVNINTEHNNNNHTAADCNFSYQPNSKKSAKNLHNITRDLPQIRLNDAREQ